MHRQPGHDTRPHVRLPPSFLGMNLWMTSQPNVVSNHKLPGSLACLAYVIDVLSMVVCTTRHWQTSGRLVQELNDCTVRIAAERTGTYHVCTGDGLNKVKPIHY